MELYLGNNKLCHLKDILYLRPLPKLIILDLSGNPVCEEENYRIYCIYNLKRLKVLDGYSVDATEIDTAKAMYDGRLTDEFIAESMGEKPFSEIQNIDLSNR
jgi:Leucine-rich repeat (LRR) protein